jgi:hypothetical protein
MNPGYLALREVMRRHKEGLKEQWSRGNFHSDKPLETSLMNEGALAEIRVIDKYLNLTYEDIEESLSEDSDSIEANRTDQSIRNGTPGGSGAG